MGEAFTAFECTESIMVHLHDPGGVLEYDHFFFLGFLFPQDLDRSCVTMKGDEKFLDELFWTCLGARNNGNLRSATLHPLSLQIPTFL